MSSNFERLHEIRNEAYAENFSMLSQKVANPLFYVHTDLAKIRNTKFPVHCEKWEAWVVAVQCSVLSTSWDE